MTRPKRSEFRRGFVEGLSTGIILAAAAVALAIGATGFGLHPGFGHCLAVVIALILIRRA